MMMSGQERAEAHKHPISKSDQKVLCEWTMTCAESGIGVLVAAACAVEREGVPGWL